AWWFVQSKPEVIPAPEVVAQKAEQPTPETTDSVAIEEAIVPVEEAATAITEAPAPAPISAPDPEAISEMTSGVSYVVLGVFSTEENARKYIKQMATRAPDVACRAYKFQGSKFMVSGFESTDGAEATAFIREHRSKLPDLWVYKRK
ncbi:MAG: SPOR domain-containing protein, partial [Rikenellaceae bacterium]|nr:SPOR domain-containing protein [Rikenellaceae bacterium]